MVGTRGHRKAVVFAGLLALAGLVPAARAGAGDLFYGGRLVDAAGRPLQGPVTLTVRFYDGESAATSVGPTLSLPSIPLVDGSFSVRLELTPADQAAVFGADGSREAWIEVQAGDEKYPRQRLGAAPFALRVPVDGVTLGFDGAGKLAVETIPVAKVSGLQTALDAKASGAHGHAIGDVAGLQGALDGKAASAHAHAVADVTGLQAALDDKASATHSHTLAGDVTGDAGATTVEGLRGKPLAPTLPTTVGQVLKWNGSEWEPGPDDGGVAGTVTGGQNLGTSGAGIADVFESTAAPNMRFRRLKQGDGVVVTQGANDVTIGITAGGCTDGQVLKRVSGAWQCAADVDTNASAITSGARAALSGTAPITYDAATGAIGVGGIANAQIAAGAAIDATKVGGGGVSNAEFSYLDGVTSAIQTQLDGKAATGHGHGIADVTGLQAALDGKAGSAHGHAIADVTGLQTALDGKAATAHGHAIADVTGLQTALDGKAASAHTHAIADTTGLQAALDGKAAATHVHSAADITSGSLALARIDATGCSDGHVLKRVSGAWTCGTSSSPAAGSTGQVQFNNGGALAGSTLHWDDAQKRLGVGTATPGSALEVRGSTMTIDAATASNNAVINLVGRSASNQYNEASIFANHSGNLVVTPASGADFFVMKGSNSTKLFQVTDGGNVGIGSTAPTANLDVTGTVKMFGARSNVVLGTVYGPATTDGFLMVFGQMDGTTGLLTVSVNADTSNPPTTQRGWGKSYNTGTYYGTVQLTVPIRKGEYYRVLCDGAASCTSPKFIGGYLAYFTPLGQ